MYRLWHTLFGWDYVFTSKEDTVARIYLDGEGVPYIWAYKQLHHLSDIFKVTFLTCSKTKYIKE